MFRFTIRDLLWLMVAAGLAVGWFVSSKQKIPEYERRLGFWEKSLRDYQSAYGDLEGEVRDLTQERDSLINREEMYLQMYLEIQQIDGQEIPHDQRKEFHAQVRRLYELYEQKKQNQLRPASIPPPGDPFAPPN